jgi:ribosome-binding factor A
VASLIKEEVGTLFQRHFRMEEYGLLTVTEVRMSPDLKSAKIYVSVFGDDAQKQKSLTLLEGQKQFVRSSIARAVRLKFVPSIAFFLDDTMDRAIKLENIFKQIHGSEAAPDGSSDEAETE